MHSLYLPLFYIASETASEVFHSCGVVFHTPCGKAALLRPPRNRGTCSFGPLWGPWHLVRIFHENPEDSQFFADPLAINNRSRNPSCCSAFGHFCWTVAGILLQQEQVRR